MQNNPVVIQKFRKVIWDYYRADGRHTLPWRRTKDPYRILVSEIMLQQTQVNRVQKFYPKFIRAFPDFAALARAPLKSIIEVWQGMGYNRRAIALNKTAQKVITEYGGRLPREVEALTLLPGIGKATAGAVAAFAFNQPVAFIETNVRRVIIFYFFSGSRNKSGMTIKKKVDDKKVLKLVKLALDRKNPREWYWALMDYGAMLGKIKSDNPNRRSSGYRKQPRFEGSRRQLRGKVLRLLLQKKAASAVELKEFRAALPELLQEGFIRIRGGKYSLV